MSLECFRISGRHWATLPSPHTETRHLKPITGVQLGTRSSYDELFSINAELHALLLLKSANPRSLHRNNTIHTMGLYQPTNERTHRV